MKTRWISLTGILLILAGLLLPAQHTQAALPSQSLETVFDFTAQAALAGWRSGAGPLPFPGTSGDHRGYVLPLTAPITEDGQTGAPGLLTVPQNKYDGYIQGIYPAFLVQKGDRFQVTVGCEAGARNCYITYRLDYITPAGATKIFWSWKEKHEGRVYNADVDLSRLAGQNVRFVLTLLASGPASNDRALWVAPRIVRAGNGQTPLPTLTATTTPLATPPPIPPAGCDRATFVADVTVRDGTVFAPGQAFTKTWRLKNTGTCAWTRDYALIFYGGEAMSAPTRVNLPWRVEPGGVVDVTINAIAPSAPGEYRSDWILQNAAGQLFGLGSNASKPFWLLIRVLGAPPLAETGYDFAANLCAAEWRSGAGLLPCPFTEGDARGFALARPTHLEDGTTANPALLTRPQEKYDGYIQGTFPAFTVQPGDRFQATVGCEHNLPCYVTLRLEYLTAGGAPRIFWKWSEKNEGKTYRVDLDLSPLAGQSVRFVLTTLAAGSAANDRAVWGAPRIVRAGLPAATPTPTPASTWLLFTHAETGFQFRYPPESTFTSQSAEFGHLELPKLQNGTNLTSKYLQYRLVNGSETCTVNDTFGPPAGILQTQEVVLNGRTFTRIDGLDAAMNHTYRYTFYTTRNASACLTLLFLLRAGNPTVYDPPRPVYDEDLEAAVFTEMMNTFEWPPLAPPEATPTPVFTAPYAVIGLPPGSSLPLRAAPGAESPILGSLPAEARNLERSTTMLESGGERWVQVRLPNGVTGWMPDSSLTESITPEAFAGDTRPVQVIADLAQAMNNADGALFASLVSPKRGLTIYYHGTWSNAVHYDTARAQQAFTSTEIIHWGPEGATGEEAIGTFSEIVLPKLLDALNAPYTLHPNTPLYAAIYLEPWPGIYQNLNYYALLKPSTPDLELDWRIWLVGFEYVDGTPYLTALLHYVWEP